MFMVMMMSNSSSIAATKSMTVRLSHSRSPANVVASVRAMSFLLNGSICAATLSKCPAGYPCFKFPMCWRGCLPTETLLWQVNKALIRHDLALICERRANDRVYRNQPCFLYHSAVCFSPARVLTCGCQRDAEGRLAGLLTQSG